MSGYILAILSGVAAALGALSYRYGAKGKVPTIELQTAMSLAGIVLWSILCGSRIFEVAPVAAVMGVVAGITQYLEIRLLRDALKRGPLSPAWCAISLGNFVPVIVYSALFLNERPTLCQYFSLAAAVGAILFASRGQDSGGKERKPWSAVYLVLLVLLFFLVSLLNIFLKYASSVPDPAGAGTLFDGQKSAIILITYIFMFLTCAADLTVSRSWVFNRYAWIGGAVLAVGGISAYFCIVLIMTLPAVLVFALSNTTSILAVALLSTLLFGEKRTRDWYLMVVLSLLAIVLN